MQIIRPRCLLVVVIAAAAFVLALVACCTCDPTNTTSQVSQPIDCSLSFDSLASGTNCLFPQVKRLDRKETRLRQLLTTGRQPVGARRD